MWLFHFHMLNSSCTREDSRTILKKCEHVEFTCKKVNVMRLNVPCFVSTCGNWNTHVKKKKRKSQSHMDGGNFLMKMLTLHIEMSIHMRKCLKEIINSHNKLCNVWQSKFHVLHFHTGCALCSSNQSSNIKLIGHFKWGSYRVLRALSNTLPRCCNSPDIETWIWSLHSALGVCVHGRFPHMRSLFLWVRAVCRVMHLGSQTVTDENSSHHVDPHDYRDTENIIWA